MTPGKELPFVWHTVRGFEQSQTGHGHWPLHSMDWPLFQMKTEKKINTYLKLEENENEVSMESV